MRSSQLPLGFNLLVDATFANYLSFDNALAVTSLQQSAANASQLLYLWGPLGSGRSHLLQATCHAATQYGRSAIYLPLSVAKIDSNTLDGLEQVDLLCLDDIDSIAGNSELEEAVFHLFNRLVARGSSLVVSANCSPRNIQIKLADLQSRLSLSLVYQLKPLNDEQKLQVLQSRAQDRGINLELSLAKFLLRRCPRNMAEIFNLLDRLDQESLARQRRLTIPFAKTVLQDVLEA